MTSFSNEAHRPSVSVLMPVYNGERYISKAVESILNQTFADYEFIIINDGSTDKSYEILQDYANEDKRIRLISRESRRLIKTLNEGLALAKAPLIARMDADDLSYPNRFEKQIEFFRRNPKCVALGTQVRLIDEESEALMVLECPERHVDVDAEHLRGTSGTAIWHPSSMFVKSAVLTVNGYSESYPHAEDIDLWLRLAEIGELCNLPDVLFDYRQHLQSIGYKFGMVQKNSTRKAREDAHRRRGLKFDSERIKDVEYKNVARWEVHAKWAWWALKGRNRKTALKHARKSVLLSPLNKEAWRVFACALRGY